MKIKVDVRKNNDETAKLAGLARITLNDSLVIEKVKIINLDGNLFVVMPSTKNNNGEFIDIAHPTTTSTRKNIEEAVLNAYKYYINEEGFIEKFRVTDVKIQKLNLENKKLKAVVSLILNNQFALNRLAIIDNGVREDGSKNLSVAFPTSTIKNKQINLVSIINEKLGKDILEHIFAEYKKIL